MVASIYYSTIFFGSYSNLVVTKSALLKQELYNSQLCCLNHPETSPNGPSLGCCGANCSTPTISGILLLHQLCLVGSTKARRPPKLAGGSFPSFKKSRHFRGGSCCSPPKKRDIHVVIKGSVGFDVLDFMVGWLDLVKKDKNNFLKTRQLFDHII